jgi:hypothetical protein
MVALTPQSQVAVAVSLAVQRVYLRVCVQVTHALDVHTQRTALHSRKAADSGTRR